jgi:hypothetical protein
MKFTKKWMVVPFEEHEQTNIENILKDNYLSNNEKVKLYNEIEIKKNQNENLKREMKNNNNALNEIENKEVNFNTNEINIPVNNIEHIINSGEELMDVDPDPGYKNLYQHELKNTIKKKLQNTKQINEKNLLKSLLKDIEINQKVFEKGYDEKIVLPVYKNTRLRKNLERKKVNYQFNDSVFDDEVDNDNNDQPIKFNIDIPNWEFINTKNETKILNKEKKLIKKKKDIKKLTKKNLTKKKNYSEGNISTLNTLKHKKDSLANSSIFLHNIKSKKENPSLNSKILNIPEVQSLINNEIEKKNHKKEFKKST